MDMLKVVLLQYHLSFLSKITTHYPINIFIFLFIFPTFVLSMIINLLTTELHESILLPGIPPVTRFIRLYS